MITKLLGFAVCAFLAYLVVRSGIDLYKSIKDLRKNKKKGDMDK